MSLQQPKIVVLLIAIGLLGSSGCAHVSGGRYYRVSQYGPAANHLIAGRGNSSCATTMLGKRKMIADGPFLDHGYRSTARNFFSYYNARQSVLSSFRDRGVYASCPTIDRFYFGRFAGLYPRACN